MGVANTTANQASNDVAATLKQMEQMNKDQQMLNLKTAKMKQTTDLIEGFTKAMTAASNEAKKGGAEFKSQ